MPPRIGVSFFITTEGLELNALTESLGIQPTDIRQKEDWPSASISAGIAKDTWELQIAKEECLAVSFQLDKLQKLLFPKIGVIRQLRKANSIETSVTVSVNMQTGNAPEMVLSNDNIHFLSQIGAEIGFDLYID